MSKGGFKGRTQTKSLDLEGAVCWVPLMLLFNLPYKISNRTSASSKVFAQHTPSHLAQPLLYYIIFFFQLYWLQEWVIFVRGRFSLRKHTLDVLTNACSAPETYTANAFFVQHCSLTRSILEAKKISFFLINELLLVFIHLIPNDLADKKIGKMFMYFFAFSSTLIMNIVAVHN